MANLWRSESTSIFCANELMYHVLRHHLSSPPCQFSIFEDMGLTALRVAHMGISTVEQVAVLGRQYHLLPHGSGAISEALCYLCT